MRRILLSTVAAATLSTALLAAPARGDRRRDFRGGDDFAERMGDRQAEKLTRALDLTVDQQRELSRLQDELAGAIRPLFDSMRADRDALEAMLDSANPDPTAVGTRAIALRRAKDQMKAAHDNFESGIVAMLNDTQKSQYEALRDARGDRDDRWGGHRFGDPHGHD